jgi:polysaccharide pyruvyl transferase WcaK-like protein
MTHERRTGVLLSGYYGCGNLGDDLLLTVAVDELRPILPGARFLLRDHGVSLPQLAPDVIPTGIDAILDDQSAGRLRRLMRFTGRVRGLLRQSGWLVFGGGTVFHDSGGLASLALHWLLCRLARLLGVRVAALGVGVADLKSGLGRRLLHNIIESSELFLVRDDAALRQCAGTKARLTGDLVFAWRSLRAAPERKEPGSPTCIGLTVSPLAGPGTVAALAEAVRRWREHGHRVVFLIFQQNATMADDTSVFAAINRQLDGGTAPVESRRLAATAPAIVEGFAGIDIVCGMRFHGLVLAAMLGRPFVGIAHDNKIGEICRQFAMPCLDAATLEAATLTQAMEKALHAVPAPRTVERCRKLAAENFIAFRSIAA